MLEMILTDLVALRRRAAVQGPIHRCRRVDRFVSWLLGLGVLDVHYLVEGENGQRRALVLGDSSRLMKMRRGQRNSPSLRESELA